MFSGTGSARNYFLLGWSSFVSTDTDGLKFQRQPVSRHQYPCVIVNYRHLPVGFEHQRHLTLVEQFAASSMGRREFGHCAVCINFGQLRARADCTYTFQHEHFSWHTTNCRESSGQVKNVGTLR